MKRVKICGIYKILSPSGKIYIGQSNDIYERWVVYNSVRCKTQRLLFRSLKKYGAENHIFEIIEECIQEKLDEREIYYIKYYDTFGTVHGLNLTSGGDGGAKSEDHKKRISESHKNWWKNNHRTASEEQIRKYKESIKIYWENASQEDRLKKGDYNRNRKMPEEQKIKKSESMKKYWETAERKIDSEETRLKKSEGSKLNWEKNRDKILASREEKKVPRTEEQKMNYKNGALKRWDNTPVEDRKLSEEHKAKIGKSNEGNQNALGYKHDEETLKIISEKSKINSKIYWDNLKNNPVEYKAICQKYSESQIKHNQEKFLEKCNEMGITPEELTRIKDEKRKEQKKRAYDRWLEKNRNTEEYKIKQREKGKRSYCKNRDKRKDKYQEEQAIIRQERLTMIF